MYQKEIIVQDSLWQSFVNGSREAYARLYELYVRPMYLYGLHFCDDRQIIEMPSTTYSSASTSTGNGYQN